MGNQRNALILTGVRKMFDNDAALEMAILKDLDKVLTEVAEEILEMLKENIFSIVYEPYEPSMYIRGYASGGFLGSWEVGDSETEAIKNVLEAKIFSNPDEMDSGGFHHGNEDVDRREFMDAVIAEGTDYDFLTLTGDDWWRQPRDYWSPTIRELDAGYFDKLVERTLRGRGLI